MAYTKKIGTLYTIQPSNFPRFKYFMTRLDEYYRRASVICIRVHREIEQSDDMKRRIQAIKGPMTVFVIGNSADRLTSASLTQSYQIVEERNISISDYFDLTLLDLDVLVVTFSWTTLHKDRMNVDALIGRYGTEILRKMIFTNYNLTDKPTSAAALKALLLGLPDISEYSEQTTNRLDLHNALNINLERRIFAVITNLKECLRRLNDCPIDYPNERIFMIPIADELQNMVLKVVRQKNLLLVSNMQQSGCNGSHAVNKESKRTTTKTADENYSVGESLLKQVSYSLTKSIHALVCPLLQQFVVGKDFSTIKESLYLNLSTSLLTTLQVNVQTYCDREQNGDVGKYNLCCRNELKRKTKSKVTKPDPNQDRVEKSEHLTTLSELSRGKLQTLLRSQGRDSSWKGIAKFALQCAISKEENDNQELKTEGSTSKFKTTDTCSVVEPFDDDCFFKMYHGAEKAKKPRLDQKAANKEQIEQEINFCLKMLQKQKRQLIFKLYDDIEHVLQRQCAVIRDMLRKNAERLFWEVNALFKQSKLISIKKQAEERTFLPEELRDTLFNRIKSMKGCGYVFGRLKILVEEQAYQFQLQRINDNIRDILNRYGIESFDIAPASSQDLVKPFHNKGVGDAIKATSFGTLGGFAECDKGAGPGSKSLCALVSAHVTTGASRISLVINQKDNLSIEIATRVSPPESDSVEQCDIEAFQVDDDKKSYMQTHFMDSIRKPKKSKLATYENYPDVGERVHIWGAISKPGYGTIASRMYNFRATGDSTPPNYILICDNEGELGKQEATPFCVEGDSGSIVCADHPDGEIVQVLSMLIGKSSRMDIQEKGDQCYATFFLKDGLEDLRRRASMLFTLCNEVSSE